MLKKTRTRPAKDPQKIRKGSPRDRQESSPGCRLFWSCRREQGLGVLACRLNFSKKRGSRVHQLGVQGGTTCSFVFQAPPLEYPLHVTWVEVVQRGVQRAADHPRNTRGEHESLPSRIPVCVGVIGAFWWGSAWVVASGIVAEHLVELRENEWPKCSDGSLQR